MGFLAGDQAWRSEPWTVSALNGYIRELFDVDFRLRELEVMGEISNFTRARSGHFYFTLKDESSQIRCVMWRSSVERQLYRPEDGDSVIVVGRVSVYESGGIYQLYAESMEPAGKGNLALAFERLKQQLQAEGLFDPEHKQPIPPFPSKIGIVTSADAAALRDILNVLRRRFPLVSVLIAPTLVQGSEAPAQIIRAVQWLDGRHDVDTIIVARGGGSIEDLWAFNEEHVARAIFEARHPIISGIGHETDFTIADFVADLRAPTPSAAAELAVPDIEQIRDRLESLQAKLLSEAAGAIDRCRWQLQTMVRTLSLLSPRTRLDNDQQRVDVLTGRLDHMMQQLLVKAQGQLAIAQARLESMSPLATLDRGYAIVRDHTGQVIRSVTVVASGDKLNIQVSDGEIPVTAE